VAGKFAKWTKKKQKETKSKEEH